MFEGTSKSKDPEARAKVAKIVSTFGKLTKKDIERLEAKQLQKLYYDTKTTMVAIESYTLVRLTQSHPPKTTTKEK